MKIGVEIEMMEVVFECGVDKCVVECSLIVCMGDGVCLPPYAHHCVPLCVVD